MQESMFWSTKSIGYYSKRWIDSLADVKGFASKDPFRPNKLKI
jgi:hypothetical protein